MNPPAAATLPVTGRAVDETTARAAELLGTSCAAEDVLSEREVPTGGTALVVLLRTGDGTPVVAKSGPPRLVTPGALAQAYAADVFGGRDRRGGTLRVPRVLGHDSRGLVVSEYVPGVPLTVAVRRGDIDAVRRTGRALAELHSVRGPGQAATLPDHFADLVKPHPDMLGASGTDPVLAAAVVAAAHDVLAAGRHVQAPAALVHRDVHPRQLHLDGDHVWLLDWDLAASGDPALDVANLLVHTRNRLAPEVAGRVVEVLLEGYGPSAELLARVPVHEAFTAVRLACKAARLHGHAATDEVASLVAQARAALDAAGVPRA